MNATDLFEENPWLDPSWPCNIIISVHGDDSPPMIFKSAQAAYQALKCPSIADELQTASAREAWLKGQNAERRPGWNNIRKRRAMSHVLMAKFDQNVELRWKLINLPTTDMIQADTASEYGLDMPFPAFWGTNKTIRNFAGTITHDDKPLNTLGELLTWVKVNLAIQIPKVSLKDALIMTWTNNPQPLIITKADWKRHQHTYQPNYDFTGLNDLYPGLFDNYDPDKTMVLRIINDSIRSDPHENGFHIEHKFVIK